MGNTIPQLLEELRAHVQRITRKPIDPDLDFLTTQIEVLSAVQPIGNEWFGYEFTPSELRVINALASRPGMAFSRDALANALYFDKADEAGAKIVDVFVRKIRVKLARAESERWIENERGLGYRLVQRNAVEALQVLEGGHKDRVYRQPKRVEWRPGILLGRKQALVADTLHSKLGQWIASGELARSGDMNPASLTESMNSIIRTLAHTAYAVENKRGFGFRMALREHAQRAA